MRKTFFKVFLLSSLIFLAAAGCSKQPGNQTSQQSQDIKVYQTVQASNLNQPDYAVKQGTTALDLLKSTHQVQTKTYQGLGEMVIGIDGNMSENGKNFWAFYINSQLAPVGAGQYQLKNSDKIEWKLEKINTNL